MWPDPREQWSCVLYLQMWDHRQPKQSITAAEAIGHGGTIAMDDRFEGDPQD